MPTARLDDRAVISLAGPDTFAFLQNLVTADMADVDRDGIGFGALLTPQGKILFDFVVHRAEEGYHLDVRSDAAEGLSSRLALYRLRSKVTVEGPRDDLAVFAAWGGASDGDAGNPDPRLAALGRRLVAAVGAVGTDAAVADWHAHRIAHAVPEGGLDYPLGDTFPHDAAMDSLGGVAFDKGCFVGQEVVSRMRHRGTARRRVVAVRADAGALASGREVMAGEQPLGRIGSTAGEKAIAILRLDRLQRAIAESTPIHAGDVPVSIQIPSWATYTLPAPAAEAEQA